MCHVMRYYVYDTRVGPNSVVLCVVSLHLTLARLRCCVLRMSDSR